MLSSRPTREIEIKGDGRVILRGGAYHKMRVKLCQLAGGHCENPDCRKWCPLERGEAHHEVHRGMGGAKRDDRIYVNGERRLFWLCKGTCHQVEKHTPKAVPPKPKMTESELDDLLGLPKKVEA